MNTRVIGMIALVLVSSTVPAAVGAQSSASGDAATSVSFDTTGDAVVDYTVGGDTMAESVQVQSQSEARAALGLDVGVDLGAVIGLPGANLSVASESDLQTTVETESGATLSAHENGHGSLLVSSGDSSQYVEVGLASSADASAESDSRVVVTSEGGTEGTLVAVGDGSVSVNDQGNVTASLDSGDRLVFRTYTEGRTSEDSDTEELIADGTATASAYLTANGTDVVSYDGDTAVSVTQQTESRVEMSVERSASEGAVVLTSVAESTFDSAESIQVQVDGEAAARASSYADLRSATEGGSTSKFLVQQSASAEASADVLVGIDHFSTRDVTMTGNDSESGDGDGGDGTSGGDSPGFGVLVALVGVLVVALVAVRRRD